MKFIFRSPTVFDVLYENPLICKNDNWFALVKDYGMSKAQTSKISIIEGYDELLKMYEKFDDVVIYQQGIRQERFLELIPLRNASIIVRRFNEKGYRLFSYHPSTKNIFEFDCFGDFMAHVTAFPSEYQFFQNGILVSVGKIDPDNEVIGISNEKLEGKSFIIRYKSGIT